MATERRRGTVTMRQVSGSARSRKVRVELGEESAFTDLPATVKVGDASYFLVRGRDGYKLLSTICPHQGGEIGWKAPEGMKRSGGTRTTCLSATATVGSTRRAREPASTNRTFA